MFVEGGMICAYCMSSLGHPNLKAIVTHGGLMTKIEAIYYGVPMVGIPLFGDQKTNIAHSVSEGIAIQIRPKELSATTLNNALTEIVNNPSYRSNVKVRSEMLRDQPMKPLDVAIYWSEHVMKYGGARHLQNKGMKLYWFQNLLLDVAAFSILIFGVLLWLLIRIYRYVSKLFEGNRASVQEKSKMH